MLKKQKPAHRDFIAKNMQRCGSGSHRDKRNDYNRQREKLLVKREARG